MPNGPKPKEDIEALRRTVRARRRASRSNVEVVGWDVQFDRIRNAAVSGEGPDITQAGTTQVPFFAALGGFEDLSSRVEDIGGEAAYPDGVWQTTQVVGQRRDLGAAVVHRGARDLLPQGRAEEGRRRRGDRVHRTGTRSRATLEKIKDRSRRSTASRSSRSARPGKKAFDLVHHVMPFVWDAGGAELTDDNTKSTINTPEAERASSSWPTCCPTGLYDKSQLERDGTQVENQFKGGRLAVWIGGPWVLALGRARRRRELGRRGAQERRHRADAGRPGGGRPTRSSAART